MKFASKKMREAMENPSPEAYAAAIGREDWAEGMNRYVPSHMQFGVIRYILFGVQGGDFLKSLVEGNLFDALRSADSTNIDNLKNYGYFFINSAPCDCYGSVEVVSSWIRMGGINGDILSSRQ